MPNATHAVVVIFYGASADVVLAQDLINEEGEDARKIAQE